MRNRDKSPETWLHAALWKLGVRLALPDELQPYRLI